MSRIKNILFIMYIQAHSTFDGRDTSFNKSFLCHESAACSVLCTGCVWVYLVAMAHTSGFVPLLADYSTQEALHLAHVHNGHRAPETH